MRNILLLTCAVFILMLANQAKAEDKSIGVGVTQTESSSKAIAVGLGVYFLRLKVDQRVSFTEKNWDGEAIFAKYDTTDHTSINAVFYALAEEGDEASTLDGSEISFKIGPNGLGFNYYGSLGVYQETRKHTLLSTSESFSGMLLGLGFGYTWDNVVFDWNLASVRSASYRYDPSTNEFSVVTGYMSLSYRF